MAISIGLKHDEYLLQSSHDLELSEESTKLMGAIPTAARNENIDGVVAAYSLASNVHVLHTQPRHDPQRLVRLDLYPLT